MGNEDRLWNLLLRGGGGNPDDWEQSTESFAVTGASMEGPLACPDGHGTRRVDGQRKCSS